MIILYKCDPEKNVPCKKRMCTIWNKCECTKDPKYAELDEDGSPIVAYARIEGKEKDEGKKIVILEQRRWPFDE